MFMLTAMSSTSRFIFFLISFIYISFHPSSTSRPTGFSSRVINRNSVESPFYNPNLTRRDHIQASVYRSFARHDFLQLLISNNASSSSIQFPSWPADGQYVLEYYIGTPPVRTYAVLDTGSSTTWLQCLPCVKCYDQSKAPVFNSEKSYSYKRLACSDPRCQKINYYNYKCSNENNCEYVVHYMGGSSTAGDVAEETLYFGDLTVENMVIGCGRSNTHVRKGEGVPGVIGLINKHESFIEQMSFTKFAYCFGDPDDADALSYAKFGEDAFVARHTTPLVSTVRSIYPFYFLNLESISVENSKLLIPEGTFELKEYRSGFIIDSGTHYTHLNKTAFLILVAELEQRLQNMKRVADPNERFKLCYEIAWLELKFVPIVTFHFTGVDLHLPLWNTWYNVQENIYCLAMHPTDGMSIFGHFQQQNYNIGFDLEKNVVSFNLMYCAEN